MNRVQQLQAETRRLERMLDRNAELGAPAVPLASVRAEPLGLEDRHVHQPAGRLRGGVVVREPVEVRLEVRGTLYSTPSRSWSSCETAG